MTSVRNIWRASARTRDNQCPLTYRYLFEHMGQPQFEGAAFENVMRYMDGNVSTGTVDIDGRPVYVVYRSDLGELSVVQNELDRLYRKQTPTSADIRFDWERWRHYLTFDNQNVKLRKAFLTDAWLDIDYGVFWTWQRVHVQDIVTNIRKTVEFMDTPDYERRKHLTRTPGRVNMEYMVGELKSRMEQKGLLKG